MSNLLKKLKAASKIKGTDVLSESEFFKQESVATDIPMLNVALSGDLDGGLTPGLLMLAGPSKHFKSSYALMMASAYLKKYDDAVLLFYDSEFGSPQSYFENFGIDTSRVLHTPIVDIETLKFDLISQLEGLDKKDNVIIIIDSVGNVASKKELQDAIDGKSVADMSRAKALKGLFRMVTPYLTMKKIPMIAINHTYKEIGLFPKDIVSGGTGTYYSSNAVWIVGRRQNKRGTEVEGYDFIINIDKSRYVKEKSKIPIRVSWNSGIEKYSGLLDIALLGGYVIKPKNGWYQKVDPETMIEIDGKYREKDTYTEEFWSTYLESEKFKSFIKDVYKIGHSTKINTEELDDNENDY